MTLLWLDYPAWLSPTLSPALPVRWYGTLIAAALIAVWFLFSHEACRRGLRAPTATGRQVQARFFLWVILTSLICARTLHVVLESELSRYLQSPWLLVWPFEDGRFTGIEGLHVGGAIGGAAAGGLLFSAVARQAFLPWADVAACCAPLVTVAAGSGNFANGEFLGRLTRAPWGVRFPNGERLPVAERRIGTLVEELAVPVHPDELLVNLPRHPVQLYEALLSGLFLSAVLWILVRKERLFPGAMVAVALVGHGVLTFLLGYYREADVAMRWSGTGTDVRFVDTLLIISEHQVTALAIAAAGLLVLAVARVIYRPEPTVATYEERQTE